MTDRDILGGAARVALFVVVAKVGVALRDVAIAWQYGVGPVSDAYNVAFALGTWLPLFLAGAIGAAIVPALVRAQQGDDRHATKRFIEELDGHALMLAVLVSLFGLALIFIAPLAFDVSDPFVAQSTSSLILAFSPFAGMMMVYYYLANRLQAQGSFSYTIYESLPAVLAGLGIVLVGSTSPILAIGAGTLAGGVLQVVILKVLLNRSRTPVRRLRLTRSAPEWSLLLAGIGTIALGQGLLSLVPPLDQYFAVKVGSGAPASIGYANRLIGIGTSLGTVILGRALLPSLAALRLQDKADAARTAERWAGYAFLAGLVALAAGWTLAPWAIRLLFERGSFTASDTANVAQLVRLGLLQLPFFLSGVAVVQWLAVEGRFTVIAAICALTLGVKAILLFALITSMGSSAIMLSTVGMYAAAWLCQLAALRRPRRRSLMPGVEQ